MLNKIIVGTIELIPWMGGFTSFFEGEEIQFTGTSKVHVLAYPKRYGFEVIVNDGRQTIYQQLLALAQTQYGPGTQLNPITVEDYISPDTGLFTVRKMLITDLKQVGSSMRYGSINLTKGTSVKLVEVETNYRW